MNALAEILELDLDLAVQAIRKADPVEVERLLYTLERIGSALFPKPALHEATGLPSKLQLLKKEYADDLAAVMDDLNQGALSPKEFEAKVRPLVRQNFEQAYKLGRGELGPGDEEWLKRAVDSEVGYARDLAHDVKGGKEITPDLRANHYAATLDGVAWNGKVESMPEGTVIHWRLGQAEHCDSCILLASHSPYDKYSLPTTPRAGDTDCRMNCKCRLEFAQGEAEPETGVFGIDAYLGPDEIPVPYQGQSLEDWLKPGDPPEGLLLPSGSEQLEINAYWNEINYNRRMMFDIDPDLDPEGFEMAMQARKAANAELIDYMEERSLWDKPPFSVDEVITARELPLSVERGIFEAGISGEALEVEAVNADMERLVQRYNLEVGKKLKKG